MTNREWFDEVAPHAIRASKKYGIPPSLTLAQAALESGYGKSWLSKKYLNFFGIKGRGPAGSKKLNTKEVIDGKTVTRKEPFRVYHTAQQAFEDHQRLLAESRYYAKAREAAPDSVAMAHALTGVYATDPEYGKKVEWIINHYNLTKFDPPKVEEPEEIRGPSIWRLILDILLRK